MSIFSHGSRVWGSLKLAKSLNISDDNNKLIFNVDAEVFEITIPNSTYKTSLNLHESELVDAINTQLLLINAPVIVKLGGIHDGNHRNVLVFEHKVTNQNYVIDSFSGNSIDSIFGSIGLTENNNP